MKKASLIGQCILFAASALLFAAPAIAADKMPPAEHGHGFDWVQHTQRTLDELKIKLNLGQDQMAAWSTWSSGVLKDARQQLDQRKVEHEEMGGKGDKAKSSDDETTPERMARGIERLRAETKWMQEHLSQLEAAQARTKVFYDTLNTNQKTIFDLFWHEMYHRMSGHDGGEGMHMEMHGGMRGSMHGDMGDAH